MLSNKERSYNAKITASFIENGMFPLLKQYHANESSLPERDATQMVLLALSAMGLSGDRLQQAASLVCPVTPLAALPQSIFELEKAQAGHA